jgi:uncharacterized protein YbjT (DUF2867 family)
MKIAVVGGTGLIGSRVANLLEGNGHAVAVISRSTGVDVITGKGLASALNGVDAVIDVADTRSLEGAAPLTFFSAFSKNLAAAETEARIRHHIGLSIVGLERVRGSYFWGKMAQEENVRASQVSHTIVRSTQFFELVNRVLQNEVGLDSVRLPPALVQPIAADDVAETLTQLVEQPPLNATIEVAGPEQISLSELARQMLSAQGDPRRTIADVGATFFGATIEYQALIPGPDARIVSSTFADWLRQKITAD